jgi:hypothetical protein
VFAGAHTGRSYSQCLTDGINRQTASTFHFITHVHLIIFSYDYKSQLYVYFIYVYMHLCMYLHKMRKSVKYLIYVVYFTTVSGSRTTNV